MRTQMNLQHLDLKNFHKNVGVLENLLEVKLEPSVVDTSKEVAHAKPSRWS
jgi:hypothetical protein